MWADLWASLWTSLYFNVLRPMIKWAIHKVTGKCELLRITYEYQPGAERTKHIEKSLQHSRVPELKRLVTDHEYSADDAARLVTKHKDIVQAIHSEFESGLKVCLIQICGYNRLFEEVEAVRKVKYDTENSQHEAQLVELWGLLMPDTELQERVSEQWTSIGFQGNDPATDFRGMGILGLQQLLFFARKYSDKAQQCLSRSRHPKIGLTYAIVGVNITGLLYHLMKKKKLRTHFYNAIDAIPGKPTMDDFHELYCYLFYEFDKYWYAERPKTIMEFNKVRDKFQKKIIGRLKKPRTVLRIEDN